MFFGDSHAMGLYSAIFADQLAVPSVLIASPGCLVYPNLMYRPKGKEWGQNCTEIAKKGLEYANRSPDIGTVVISMVRKGCRVVGIAGGAEKCRYVVDELGFDACVDYKAPDFEEQLAAATPNYVDVLFENVGGPVLDAVLARINDHARITLCGNISDYNADEPYGLKGLRQLLMHRVTVYSFVIAEHRDYWPGAIAELSGWLAEGKIKYKEDIAEGLDSSPKAFIAMLTGGNFGKQLVNVGA